jgi:hypothetical protein
MIFYDTLMEKRAERKEDEPYRTPIAAQIGAGLVGGGLGVLAPSKMDPHLGRFSVQNIARAKAGELGKAVEKGDLSPQEITKRGRQLIGDVSNMATRRAGAGAALGAGLGYGLLKLRERNINKNRNK